MLSLAYGDSADRPGHQHRPAPAAEPGRSTASARRDHRPLAERRPSREDQAAPDEDGLDAAGRRQAQAAGHPLRRGPPQHPGDPARPPPVSPETAVTAAYRAGARHRGAFQLEDTELASERLPDDRTGAAGRCSSRAPRAAPACCAACVDEPDALPGPPATALQICHFDPDTGADLGADEPAQAGERCAAACYDCLLSYGNQRDHELIDRHLVRDLLLSAGRRAADDRRARPAPTAAARPHWPQSRQSIRWSGRVRRLAPLDAACACPTTRRPRSTEAARRPDFVYRLRDGNVAVFVDGAGARRHRRQAQRDAAAEDASRDLGWNVIRFRHERRLGRRSPARYPSVFGARDDGDAVDEATRASTTYAVGSLVARPRPRVGRAAAVRAAELARAAPARRQRRRGRRRLPRPRAGQAGARSTPPDPGRRRRRAASAGLLRTALRLGFRASAGPFRSLARLAVEPRAYQLVPLLMALRQDTVRLLIADDVGIGKTVEAGLIAAELLDQGERDRPGRAVLARARRAVAAASCATKFGIDAELVLPATVRRLERGLLHGRVAVRPVPVTSSSPPTSSSRPGAATTSGTRCPDLVIVDEAHTCVSDGTGGAVAGRTSATSCSRGLADDRDRHLILVTATPHSGKEEAFRNLLGLLDPGPGITSTWNRSQGRRAAGPPLRAAPPRRHPPLPRRGHAVPRATG